MTVGGSFERWPVQVWVSGTGIEVKSAKDKGKLTLTVRPDATPGPHWLRLYDEQGASAPRPFMVGTLPEVLEMEPNDDPATAHKLDCSTVVVNGRLSRPGDVDGFSLALRKGQTLVASLEANRHLRSPMDGVLQVVSSSGFVLAHNDDTHGMDPQIVFPVPRDDTYIVRTFAFPAVPDSGIRFAGGETFVYRLTLTTAGFIEHAWPLAIAKDSKSEVDLIGWNIPSDRGHARALPRSGDLAIVFHRQLANWATVQLEPHTAHDLCQLDSTPSPKPLTAPFTASGRLKKPGAVGVIAVLGKKGQTLGVEIEAQTIASPLLPVLQVLDAAGKSLARTETKGPKQDCELTFTPAEDGVVRVQVSDLTGAGGSAYIYRLRVRPAEPDYALTVATDRFQAVVGKPLDIPVTLNKRHGFSKEVELTIDGLPPGVKAELIPLAPTEKGKIPTLRVIADKIIPGVPISIRGHVTGASGTAKLATAAPPELSEPTTNLWFTATTSEVKLPASPKKK
jgi:hypothetical protein